MSTENPWRKLSSRQVYRNPWISVREDSVIRPDGKPGIYGVVETRRATGVIALNDRQELVLVGQYRYPTERYSWEIPEGGTDLGEEPLAAIRRELQEEAGLSAARWDLLAGDIQLSNCYSDELAYLYTAAELTSVAATPEGTEQLMLRWVTLVEALRMVDSGEISDAMTVLALLIYSRKLAGASKK